MYVPYLINASTNLVNLRCTSFLQPTPLNHSPRVSLTACRLTMKLSAPLLVLLGTMVEPRAMLGTKAEPTAGDPPGSLEMTDGGKRPTGIVIVSQGRSGSTLMGALFRQQNVSPLRIAPQRGLCDKNYSYLNIMKLKELASGSGRWSRRSKTFGGRSKHILL